MGDRHGKQRYLGTAELVLRLDYRQALVLHEAFDDSRVSPRMEAVLERLRVKGRRSDREAA